VDANLTKRLWIANVAIHDAIKWLLKAALYLILDRVSLLHNLASHGILGIHHIRVQHAKKCLFGAQKFVHNARCFQNNPHKTQKKTMLRSIALVCICLVAASIASPAARVNQHSIMVDNRVSDAPNLTVIARACEF
jgi:hypothetical protein